MTYSVKKYLRTLMIFATVCLTAILSCSFQASADPKKSKALAREAAKAYNNGDYETALTKFNDAYREDNNPSILYNLGRVYESRADFANAVRQYTMFVSSPEVDQEARSDALERIKTLTDVIQLQEGLANSNIPAGTPTPSKSTVIQPASKSGCVDINTAGISEFMTLSGIGESKANKIIESRNAQGPFKTHDDLGRVKGISIKTIDKFRSDLCPIGAAAPTVPGMPSHAAAAAPTAKGNSGCIDINRASEKDLIALKGIGEATAKKIVDLRTQKGGFKNINELTEVPRFSQKKVDAIRPELCPLGDPQASAPSNAKATMQEKRAPEKPVNQIKSQNAVILDI